MLTAREMQPAIGTRALLKLDKLTIFVTVIDCRQVFDRADCLVQPVAGVGQQWVSAARLREVQDVPAPNPNVTRTPAPFQVR